MPKAKPQSLKNHHALEDAFHEFNSYAEKLTASYQDLEKQVVRLNRELLAERNKSHQQLAEKERYANRLSQLLFALPAGVIVLDMRGQIQECNSAASDLLGKPLAGELWRNIIERVFEPTTHAGQEARLKDGRTVSISTCPLGNEPGQIILLMDVTETRFLQQSLERHQRLSAMGEMSAKLAHQIRTPLASALLYVSNLSKGTLPEPERLKFIEKTLSRLQHLENVVEDMLSFSRVGDQNQDLISVSDLLVELQQAMEVHLESSGCRMYVQEHEENIYLKGNQDALLGVLQNIVTNAIQACGEQGSFWLSCSEVQQHRGIPAVDIIFKDNGPGISEEDVNKIFEPFYTTRSQGTGLGLAVARAVIENHGGSIWIDSTSSKGTTFVIRLPVSREAETPQF